MVQRIRSGFVDFPWGQVHVRGLLRDTGKPPVLLLHQTPLSAITYERVLAPLAEKFRPIAVDTPGFGFSDSPGGPWQMADYAEILHSVCEQLELNWPLVVGQHTGACLAIELSLRYPGSVRGLVLVGVPCVSPEVARERLAAKRKYEISDDGFHLSFIWHRMQFEQYPGPLPKELATRHVVDHLLAGPDNYLYAYRAVYTYPIQDRLRDLDAARLPVFLLAGSNDCIKHLHDQTTEFLPSARTRTLEGRSDFIMDEDPVAFVREVSMFFDEMCATVERMP